MLAACGGGDDGDTGSTSATPAPSVDTSQIGTTSEVGEGGSGAATQDESGWTVNGYTFGPDNPRTISMYIISDAAAANPDNKIIKKIQDELGVTLDIMQYSSGDQITQNQLLVASEDYPDIIAQSDSVNAEVIKGGALIDLQPLLNSGNYPLLAEHVRTNLAKLLWTGADAPAGLYVLPNYNRFYGRNPETKPSNINGFFIQKAVLEYLGYPDLSNMTLEKYFGMIREYKEAFPEIDGAPTIGFTLDGGRSWAIPNMPACLEGSPNNGGVVADTSVSPHTVRAYAVDDYAYRTWKFLNEMYAEGLVDPESFGSTTDQYNEKLASGRTLGTFHQGWALGTPEGVLNGEGKSNRTWVATTPTFDGIKPYYAWNPTMNIQQGFGISVDAADPAEILAFIEIMMTEYWQKIMFWGIEGEDYLVGSDGLFYRTEEMREQQLDVIWQASNQARVFRDQLPKHQGFWPDGNADSPGNQPSEFYAGLSDYDKEFLGAYGFETWGGFIGEIPAEEPGYYPLWQREWLSEDAQEANTTMEGLSGEFIAKLVMCDPADFDGIWEEYKTQFDRVDQTDWLASHEAWIAKYGWE
jgi:putative aldouronate transport system substrate-binding protein